MGRIRLNGKLFGISPTCEFTRATFDPDGQGSEQCGAETVEMFQLTGHKTVGLCERHAARLLQHCYPVGFDFADPTPPEATTP